MTETVFKHGLYYPDAHKLSLSDIAATLTAHERLLPVVRSILEHAISGIEVQSISIELDDITRSSLSEAFFVAIFVVFQKDLEKDVPAIIQSLTGYHIDGSYDTIVTVLFMVALYAGTMKLLGKGHKGKEAPASINLTFNNYLDMAASQLGVPTETVQKAVEAAIPKQRLPSVMRAAIDLFRPAKRGGNGGMVPLNLPPVPAADIAEFPSEVALAELEDDTVPIPVPMGEIRLRAVDRDKSERGWAGVLTSENLKTKRLPVRLYPTVDREMLASLDHATVEAIVECVQQDGGGLKPKRIHILSIHS